jgi:large subunit ribosomal protein L24
LKGRYRLAILLKKGDKVQVIAGKDNAVIVEGVNLRKKHSKASQKNPQGGIIQSEGPLNISNVQLLCSSCGELTRPLVKISDKERIRACRKCEAQI